jgi:hypothetical protein
MIAGIKWTSEESLLRMTGHRHLLSIEVGITAGRLTSRC